jgi:hypothetical protein
MSLAGQEVSESLEQLREATDAGLGRRPHPRQSYEAAQTQVSPHCAYTITQVP